MVTREPLVFSGRIRTSSGIVSRRTVHVGRPALLLTLIVGRDARLTRCRSGLSRLAVLRSRRAGIVLRAGLQRASVALHIALFVAGHGAGVARHINARLIVGEGGACTRHGERRDQGQCDTCLSDIPPSKANSRTAPQRPPAPLRPSTRGRGHPCKNGPNVHLEMDYDV